MSLADFEARIAALRAPKVKAKVEAKPIAPAMPKPKAPVRIWRTIGRFVRVEEQQCRCCGGSVKFIGGHYALQVSGLVSRRILESALAEHELEAALEHDQAVWEAEPTVVEECASCMGLTGVISGDWFADFEGAVRFRQAELFGNGSH